jgi:hypothetical protein
MKARSPVWLRLEALLRDRSCTLEEVYAEVMVVVPPGKALRTYQRVVTKRVERGDGPIHRYPLTEDEKIASGARRIVYETLTNMVKYGWVERIDVDGQPVFAWAGKEQDQHDADPMPDLDELLPVTQAEFKVLLKEVSDLRDEVASLRRASVGNFLIG